MPLEYSTVGSVSTLGRPVYIPLSLQAVGKAAVGISIIQSPACHTNIKKNAVRLQFKFWLQVSFPVEPVRRSFSCCAFPVL